MKYWNLDREGFITNYMVSGPRQEDLHDEKRDPNQLKYEAYLRSILAKHTPVEVETAIKLGEESRLGLPWKYYYYYGCSFLDLSGFYSILKRLSFDAASILHAPGDMQIKACLWSYSAVDLYCNGVKAGSIAQPVYKPIQKQEVVLPLKKGDNLIYLACENLGVRDARSVVGLQILEMQEQLLVTIPDQRNAEEVYEAQALLDQAVLTDTQLILKNIGQKKAVYTYKHFEDDFAKECIPAVWHDFPENGVLELCSSEYLVTVRIEAAGMEFARVFERTERIVPEFPGAGLSYEENRDLIFRRIADVMSESRGEKYGFPISNILARKYFNDTSMDDERLTFEMLEMIDERYDCADFLMCGLIRLVKRFPPQSSVMEKVREVMLNFRYWMDMDGFDGMCFWSENHSLLFYSCAMTAGEMFPEDYFPRASMTGRELAGYGRSKVLQWIEDVETGGFEEFLSTVYMCVTFVALLHLVDFADPEISERARGITDNMFRSLARHVFKNGIIAPMGRVYRSVLYPFQGAMSLMNLANPKLPYSFGEGWLGFYASSSYVLPEELVSLMEMPAEISYVTGNARIMLEKNADYCLTSVQSPREPFTRWVNETLLDTADTSTHSFTKSFNERFHGTTCFQPGVYGYQQHMWYAALTGTAAVFVNHPGSACEDGDMRPGYWHGNGQMPAVKQQHGMIGSIYCISKEHPIHFTHLYCPECRFDQVCKDGNWIFLRKESGYLAVWCSGEMEKHNGRNFNCEYRVYEDQTAWFVYASGQSSCESFETFMQEAQALEPAYDPVKNQLTAKGYELTYRACRDETQYL